MSSPPFKKPNYQGLYTITIKIRTAQSKNGCHPTPIGLASYLLLPIGIKLRAGCPAAKVQKQTTCLSGAGC
jgi:hypothetical protein